MLTLLFATALASPSCDALDAGLAAKTGDRCGTTALQLAARDCPEVLARHGLSTVLEAPPVTALPRGAKVTRDSAGSWDNLVETDNFAVKWGTDTSVDPADVQTIAAAFELAWDEQVDGWGYPQPRTSQTYKFNVYIGDTGGPAPSAYGNGGYFYYDDDGYPMIVLNRGTLDDPVWGADVAIHEFFHAIQDAVETYTYTGAGAWYYEATAVWSELEVFGPTVSNSSFLFGYALLPDLNVGFFDYPDEGLLQEYHQYGAFVFIRYISEIASDEEMVKRSWLLAPRGGDPLVTLDLLLQDEGTSLAEAHTDFARRLSTFDFPEREVYIDAYSPYANTPGGRAVAGQLGFTGDVVVANPQAPPQAWGINTWEVSAAQDFAVTFTPQSTPVAFTAALLATGPDGPVTVELATDGTPTRVDDVLDLAGMRIVVTAQGDTADHSTTYPYTLTLESADSVGTDTGDTGGVRLARGGCGCTAGGASAGWLLLAMPMLVVRRRR